MVSTLLPQNLRNNCDVSGFDFNTTADLSPDRRIIGQPRGTQAIKFGISVKSPGYNIYVMGESGTGRTTAIKHFIENQARDDPMPPDWVYVHNFREPHRPLAISLPKGNACLLEDTFNQLIEELRVDIPAAYDNQTYRDEVLEIQHLLAKKRDLLFQNLQTKGQERGAAILPTSQGFQLALMVDGKPIDAQTLARMPEEFQRRWQETAHYLQHELNETAHQARLIEREAHENIQELDHEVAKAIIDSAIKKARDVLQGALSGNEKVFKHLERVHADLIENANFFRQENEQETQPQPKDDLFRFRRYRVNVIVDNKQEKSAPVIVEYNPTIPGLLGRVEHEMRFGGQIVTDFTLFRCGALHAANGGYLVLRARDLFAEPGAWEMLKRTLVRGSIRPDDPATRQGATTRSLDPEEIPLNLKVILIGPPQTYYTLHQLDEDFHSIFKVAADFDMEMERNLENELEYATFIAQLQADEGLLDFTREAVGRVIEYGSRLAGSQKKLSARFGNLADLLRESNYWALQNGHELVTMEDVRQAILTRAFYRNRIETRMRERSQEGKQLILSEGEVVGQINGLSVLRVGEHTFGQPSRITARTYVGKAGVVQIDREVKLAGPIHNKGVLTLVGYLGGKYASEQPLSLSAQISFEQNYGGVDGDSASSTELYAILSSLAEIPIKQSLAVTGSVNQRGEIQAIGGATEKIEGWFNLCKERGLTGDQGVLIPASNVDDLMLYDEVVEAVAAGKFHIYAVATVDEGIEVLTGRPAEEVHEAVRGRLQTLSDTIRFWGSSAASLVGDGALAGVGYAEH